MFIVPLLGNAAFDPETVETLSAAFDDAWQQIKQSASTLRGPHTSARESCQMHYRDGARRRAAIGDS